MRYRDFAVKIGPHHHHGRAVQVIDSPAGEAIAPFTRPFSGIEVETVLGGIARTLNRSDQRLCRDLHLTGSAPCDRFTPQWVGEELFRSLLSGEVLSRYDRSIGHSGEGSRYGLRLKLRFDLDDPEIADLARLPWELLKRPGEGPVALDRRTPVVRYLEVMQPVHLPPLPKPLRILVVRAEQGAPLGLDEECQTLRSVWAGIPNVEVSSISADLDQVRKALRRQGYHVLHYMGHGLFDPHTGQGSLPFLTADRTLHAVSGELLATQLRATGLQLVFLNACNTARAWSAVEHNPYSGIATALVRSGLPAVLAMQQPISDQAAVVFSRAFYESLAAGDPIDAATCEARLAVHRSPTAAEWSIPVLFMRVSDGQIFEPPNGDEEEDTESNGTTDEQGLRWWHSALVLASVPVLVAAVLTLLLLTGLPGSGARHGLRQADDPGAASDSTVAATMVTKAAGPASPPTGPQQDVPDWSTADGADEVISEPPNAAGGRLDCIPRSWCCRICRNSHACGDACIRPGFDCRQPPGCACNLWQICGHTFPVGMSVDPSLTGDAEGP